MVPSITNVFKSAKKCAVKVVKVKVFDDNDVEKITDLQNNNTRRSTRLSFKVGCEFGK